MRKAAQALMTGASFPSFSKNNDTICQNKLISGITMSSIFSWQQTAL